MACYLRLIFYVLSKCLNVTTYDCRVNFPGNCFHYYLSYKALFFESAPTTNNPPVQIFS